MAVPQLSDVATEQLRKSLPRYKSGMTANIEITITDDRGKTRIQNFIGVIIKRQGIGISETITVRKHSFGVDVERVFPIHSPIFKINILEQGKVRRARIYYLRNLSGKAARLKKITKPLPMKTKNQ